MEEGRIKWKHEGKRLQANEVISAFRSLTISKQRMVQETIGVQLTGETPEGLQVTARSRRELRRFIRAKDPHMLEWIRGFEAGDVLYDIGANCGGITLTAGAMHRDQITIVAIEPSFSNFESLARNLSNNRMLGFVVPLQVALLDRTGLETMFYRSTKAGTSQHAVGDARGASGDAFDPAETQLVPTFKLDDVVTMLSLPAPTRVKIDVDGYEAQVLRGCTRTLAAGTIRDLMIEVSDHDSVRSRLCEVSGVLAAAGYDVAKTFEHPEPEEAEDRRPGLSVGDYLFQRRSA
jgi:FkbM family methyltransferase